MLLLVYGAVQAQDDGDATAEGESAEEVILQKTLYDERETPGGERRRCCRVCLEMEVDKEARNESGRRNQKLMFL